MIDDKKRLVVGLKEGDAILINGGAIEIKVLTTKTGSVRLLVLAPATVKIDRIKNALL